MTCTRNGCHNTQCYVCHKSCGYSHFDDASRGGKSGNCPLFDSVEKRHEDEVRAAEEQARKKVSEENPDVDAEALEIMASDKVKGDGARRRRDPYPQPQNAIPAVRGRQEIGQLAPLDSHLQGPATG
jgi:TRIAD3 protein (E3 ubiquitin-protein ligase RNF216)